MAAQLEAGLLAMQLQQLDGALVGLSSGSVAPEELNRLMNTHSHILRNPLFKRSRDSPTRLVDVSLLTAHMVWFRRCVLIAF